MLLTMAPRMADAETPASDTRCVFCSEHEAVVYCRADSARLCLFCDQVVHAANLLSKKHLRSQICEHCGGEPATVRCLTDKLVLCRECDWEVHGSCSASASHVRITVEGYSGCPSAKELAAMLGFMLLDGGGDEVRGMNKNPREVQIREDMTSLPVDHWDMLVPNSCDQLVHEVGNDEGSILGKSNWRGKFKQLLSKQLVQLYMEGSNVDRSRGGDVPENFSGDEGKGVTLYGEYIGEQQQGSRRTASFSKDSNVRPSSPAENLRGDRPLDDVQTAAGQCTQIWDFHLGQSWNEIETTQRGISRGENDGKFKIKKLCPVKETSMNYSTHHGDLLSFRCGAPSDDIIVFDNCSNHKSYLCTVSSESNTLSLTGQSHGTVCGKLKSFPSYNDNQLDGQYFFVGDCMKAETGNKIDMELQAETRGNAMKRYQEKKKHRRFDKHVRYESRKARADSRKRVKGRFVKASKASNDEV